MTTTEIIAEVVAYLKAEDWHFEFNEEKHIITAGVSLKSKLSHAKLYISFNPNGYTVYGLPDMKASGDAYAETARYLHYANYGKRNGNFEFDFRDGEVRYKVYTNVKGLTSIPKGVIEDSISIPFIMLDRYGNNLAGVMLGFMDAETANKKDKEK